MVSLCVVEGPVSSLWVNAFGGNDTATDTGRNRLHNDILSTIAHLFLSLEAEPCTSIHWRRHHEASLTPQQDTWSERMRWDPSLMG